MTLADDMKRLFQIYFVHFSGRSSWQKKNTSEMKKTNLIAQ